MFTFIQLQTEPARELFFYKDNRAFFSLVQKALLLSLYEEKLISAEVYQQCLYLRGKEWDNFD